MPNATYHPLLEITKLKQLIVESSSLLQTRMLKAWPDEIVGKIYCCTKYPFQLRDCQIISHIYYKYKSTILIHLNVVLIKNAKFIK
jgi:hypothetical protein